MKKYLLGFIASVLLLASPVCANRVRTLGFETQSYIQATGEGFPMSDPANGATAVFSTEQTHGGVSALKFDSGNGNAYQAAWEVGWYDQSPPPYGTTLYFRCYVYLRDLPTSQCMLMEYQGGDTATVLLKPTGALALCKGNSPTSLVQLGSDSSTLLVPGQWYRIELAVKSTSMVGHDYSELMLDGSSVSASNNINFAGAINETFMFGWIKGSFPNMGASKVCYFDDIAINNSLGTTQNSWPGAGTIVLSMPMSDNSIGAGWTDGVGGVTNLWEGVSSIPANGKAVPLVGTQIRNGVSTSTSNYDANMTPYEDLGITSSNVVTVVQGICMHAEEVAAGTKNGAIAIVSNPAGVGETSFKYGDDSGKMTDFLVVGSTWRAKWSAAVGAPVVDLAVPPVLRVGKRSNTNSKVDFCFMGLYVEYQ